MKSPEPIAPLWDADVEDAASERAAEIFAKRRWGPWREADQAGLDAWLGESALHEVAWLRIKSIADRADHLAAVSAIALKQSRKGENSSYRRWLFSGLIAASLALMLPYAISYVAGLMTPPDRTYSTEVGGRTTLKFADGSVFDLNTNTSLRIRMTNAERIVWLERGEVWFHVTHDAARPFTVVVDRSRISDLGTEFLVSRRSDGTEVALLNGKAALTSEGAPAAMLSPGDDAKVTAATLSVTRKSPQVLADELAWRRGMLIFRKTRLADAVREVNRYTPVKFVIADPSLADLRFSGEIKNDNLKDFLETAQTMMNVRADWHGNDIWLSRSQAEKKQKARRTTREP
jgi:transmembrane sensor